MISNAFYDSIDYAAEVFYELIDRFKDATNTSKRNKVLGWKGPFGGK